MDILCLTLALVIVLTLIYWFSTKTFDHWKNQKVPSMPNPIPALGHMLPIITFKENLPTFLLRIYKQTDASMIGFFFLRQPILVVRDPELVKCVLQTNFLSFRNNATQFSEKNDPILVKNPFFTRDPHLWKVRRAKTASQLTGKKLRDLFVIIQEVCSKMCAYNARKIKENGDYFECELKEYFLRCTGEVVANAAFAIEGQSFEDNPERLSFARVAKTIFEPTVINGIKQALLVYFPDIADLLGISVLQKKTDNFFRENIKLILKQRKQSNSAPKDYLQFAVEANDEGDIDSIIAEVIIFYGDVYETSSTTLATVTYYLSENENIQNKLRSHILSALEATSGAITYDSLNNMNYLDQVIQESMRLLVPVGMHMKACTEAITLKGSDGLTCHLQPGDLVYISVMGLHLDSKYWTNPDAFDPERFSSENQAKRSKYVFSPFGEGPRMCVGMRLGLMLVKLAIASLLTKYSIEHSPKTKVPLELDTVSILPHVKGGLWCKFKKLNQNSEYENLNI